MRKSDIYQAPQTPGFSRTEGMYLDTDKPVDQMDLQELQRALCAKANGDVLACEECQSRCKFGKRIVELLKPVEMERRVPDARRVAAERAGGAAKSVRARQKYLTALASGDPKKWFAENGFNARGGLYMLRKTLGDMTPEEAREELWGPRTEIEPRPETTRAEVKTVPVRPQPSLNITAVHGNFYDYQIDEKGDFALVQYPSSENHIPVCKIPELCDELMRLHKLLGGAEHENP